MTAIDDINIGQDDKVIVTLGANVEKDLFPEGVLKYDDASSPISPDTPLETSTKQPHSSVWLLVPDAMASKIEDKFLGLNERDFIHIDVTHPWQITLISLGDKYYKKQPDSHRLFYIAMNDLSGKGLHIDKKGTECSEEELAKEVLKRLGVWDVVREDAGAYTATVDSRARQFENGQDSAPIVRFMPGEAKNALVFPDTECDNLAVIGERVKAYQAPVPTTEWVTETGHRAIQYLLHGETFRMSKREYKVQEAGHSRRFVFNWIKYKLKVFGSNFKSSVTEGSSVVEGS